MTSKTLLRTKMRAVRRRLAAEHPDAAARLDRNLPRDRLPPVAVYSLYHPMGAELDPSGIRLGDAAVALPVAIARDAPLVFRLRREGELMVTDAFGIGANINFTDNLDDNALPDETVHTNVFGGISLTYTF